MASNFATLGNTKLIARLSEGFGIINDPDFISLAKTINTKDIATVIKESMSRGSGQSEDMLFVITIDEIGVLTTQLNKLLEVLAKVEKEFINSYLQNYYDNEDVIEYASKKLPKFINITIANDKTFNIDNIRNVIKWIDCILVVLNVLGGMDGYDVVKFIRKYIYTSIKEHDLQTLANYKIPGYLYELTTNRITTSLSDDLKDYITDILQRGIYDGSDMEVIDPKKVHKYYRLYNEFQQISRK
ncbi:hypothetical protein D1872_38250 [compost metagenome]